jgi:hypothetical protein
MLAALRVLQWACIRIVIAGACAQAGECVVVAKAWGIGGVAPILGMGRVEAEERHGGQGPMMMVVCESSFRRGTVLRSRFSRLGDVLERE